MLGCRTAFGGLTLLATEDRVEADGARLPSEHRCGRVDFNHLFPSVVGNAAELGHIREDFILEVVDVLKGIRSTEFSGR